MKVINYCTRRSSKYDLLVMIVLFCDQLTDGPLVLINIGVTMSQCEVRAMYKTIGIYLHLEMTLNIICVQQLYMGEQWQICLFKL